MQTQSSGPNLIQRIDQFSEMKLLSSLLKALEKMNIFKPTDVQAQAIPTALKGHDIVAIAQTGSGKTMAFLLPVINELVKKTEARALILAPSREMAQQIFRIINELCQEQPLSTCLVIGGIPSAKQVGALKKNPRIIVGTPGRLNDHLITNKLLLKSIEFVIIDEADRMLDMGFAPQLKNIKNTLRGKLQTTMFSASFNPAVEDIASLFLSSNSVMIRTVQAEAPVTSLSQTVLFIDKFAKNERLLDELNLINNGPKGSVMVFCGNQGSCERTGEYLKEYGFKTDLLHGGLTQGHRNRVLRDFREGKITILVATDVLARGIDVAHIDHVINFDLPFQAEDFLHRIGRTARAGRSGSALTFVTSQDTRMYQKIKGYLQGAKEVTLNSDFTFVEKVSYNDSNRYKNKKLDQKRPFDSTQRISNKPKTKVIGSLNKSRNDKYKDLVGRTRGS